MKRTKNESKLHYANRLVWHGKTALRWLKTHKRFILAVVGPDPYRVQMRDHRWELKYGLRLKRQELQRRYQASLPSHYKGWLCIHLGPNFNSTGPHEGNSSSGTYTGPLQMTNPWMGYSGNWGSMSLRSVFSIAEKVAAGQGFSYSFMSGQWPRTFPPCANYF